MYHVEFYSGKVERRFNEMVDMLRKSRPAEYNNVVKAFASLRTAPRQRYPGDKHPLGNDRRGTWSMRITGPWRLTYTIDDRRLLVTGLEVVGYH